MFSLGSGDKNDKMMVRSLFAKLCCGWEKCTSTEVRFHRCLVSPLQDQEKGTCEKYRAATYIVEPLSDFRPDTLCVTSSISTYGQTQAEMFHSKHKKTKEINKEEIIKTKKKFPWPKQKQKIFQLEKILIVIRDLCMLFEYTYGLEMETHFHRLMDTFSLWQSVKGRKLK